ncbi:toprim domain-containing protein, partial [Candidatus Azambacteria bacterium]|nr:toprim domain-containing protein [Candidatus Azambacteria bacterium]
IHSEAGKEALAYLEKRGLKKETMDEFRIGYALPEWDGLYNFLALKGYNSEMMEKAGLVLASTKTGKKKYFDRFRDRIMFPISDANGYIVGFTGRYLTPKENEGKYVNSPQTPIFDKSKILYGLDKAKVEIKKEGYAVLMEGQMDLIMSWQDGVKNAVASSGTALTKEQAKLLKRYALNLKMAFDMDSAGDTATKRGIDVVLQNGLNASIVRIPDGKDPADFVLSHGGELKSALEKSIPVMDYYFETALAKNDKSSLEGKKKISEEILPNIKKILNSVERYHWLDKLSNILNTDIKYLEEEMKNIKVGEDRSYGEKNIQKNVKSREVKRDDKIIASLISFLIKDPKNFPLLESSGFLSLIKEEKMEMEKIVSEDMLSLFDFFEKCVKIGEVSEMLNKSGEEEKTLLNPIIMQSEMIGENIDLASEINFLVKKIKNDILSEKRAEMHLKIKEAEAMGDHTLVEEHLKKLNEI